MSLYASTIQVISQLYSLGFEECLFPDGVQYIVSQVKSTHAVDPVQVLWDCFRLGTPLVQLYNLLGLRKLDVPSNGTLKARQKSVYTFLVACKEELKMSEENLFIVSDLYKDDTNCLLKAIRTVSGVLDQIQNRGLMPPELKLPFWNKEQVTPTDNYHRVVQELLTTERSYVADLQTLQKYRNDLVLANAMSQDEIHYLFCNLDELVDFQNRFLVALESTLALSSSEQRIGALFYRNEEPFGIYEAMCRNYDHASLFVEQNHERLAIVSWMEPLRQLPSYLIRPVQRICKYPLLLNELVKWSNKESPYDDELNLGWQAMKRVTDKINEMKRVEENSKNRQEFMDRIQDFQDLDPSTFGKLILKDTFMLVFEDSEREYILYLFQTILICCQEPTRKKKNSLAIRGKIRLFDIDRVTPDNQYELFRYELHIFWMNSGVKEVVVLKCRNEEQGKLWKDRMDILVAEAYRHEESIRKGLRHLSPLSYHMDTPPWSPSVDSLAKSTPVSPRNYNSSNQLSPRDYTSNQRTQSVNEGFRPVLVPPTHRSTSVPMYKVEDRPRSLPAEYIPPPSNAPPSIPLPLTPRNSRLHLMFEDVDRPISPASSHSSRSSVSPDFTNRRTRYPLENESVKNPKSNIDEDFKNHPSKNDDDFKSPPARKESFHASLKSHPHLLVPSLSSTLSNPTRQSHVKIRAHLLDYEFYVSIPSRPCSLQVMRTLIERKMRSAGISIEHLQFIWKDEMQEVPLVLVSDDDLSKALLLGRQLDQSVNIWIE